MESGDSLGVGAVLIVTRLAIDAKEYEQYDRAGERNKSPKYRPSTATYVVHSADEYGKRGYDYQNPKKRAK